MSDRNGYIGRAPGDSSIIIARKTYEPTGVQTDFTFSAGYTPGYCDVYLNGVKLITEKDYTASNGSTVGLTSEAQSGDIIEVVAYKAFNLGVPISDVTGNLDVTGNISASSSITADGAFYGDGSNLSGIVGAAVTQYIAANSLTVLGSPGVSTITRLGVTDAVVTGIITANGLSGNVTGAACTFTTGTFSGNVSIAGSLTYEDVTNVDSIGVITARSGIAVTGGQLTVGVAFSVGNAGVATAKGLTVTGTSNLYDDVNFYGAAGDASWDKSNSYLIFPDNTKAVWGSSGTSDLSIYHNSGTTCDRIDSGNKLEIRANASIDLSNEDGSSTYAFFNESGSSDLYYSNSKKFETTNDGVVITGIATATGLSITGTSTFTGDVTINADELFIADSIKHAGDTDTIISFPTDNTIRFTTANSQRLQIGSGGDIDICGSAAGITSVTWDASANIMYFKDKSYIYMGDGGDFRIKHDGTNTDLYNTTGWLNINSAGGTLYVQGNYIAAQPSGGGDVYFTCTEDAAVDIYYDNSKKWETTNDGTVTTGIGTFTGGVIVPDGSSTTTRIGLGNAEDLLIFHNGTHSFMQNATGELRIQSDTLYLQDNANSHAYVTCVADGAVGLRYDNVEKLATTNEGVNVSGMMSATAGLGVTGGMWEGAFIKAGKLTDNKTIGISTSNIFVFTTQETTTGTPNIIWNDSYALSSKMNIGDAVTVTVITTAAAGGYCANWTIDGNAVTEQWNGGSAPSAGGSDGYDIYTLTLVRKAAGTGDTGWLVFANVSNFT